VASGVADARELRSSCLRPVEAVSERPAAQAATDPGLFGPSDPRFAHLTRGYDSSAKCTVSNVIDRLDRIGGALGGEVARSRRSMTLLTFMRRRLTGSPTVSPSSDPVPGRG